MRISDWSSDVCSSDLQAVDLALAELDAPADAVAAGDRSVRYAQWAQAALAGEDVGSSPGGEQPKFTATVTTPDGRHAVLVQFAVADSGQAARRGTDLPACRPRRSAEGRVGQRGAFSVDLGCGSVL